MKKLQAFTQSYSYLGEEGKGQLTDRATIDAAQQMLSGKSQLAELRKPLAPPIKNYPYMLSQSKRKKGEIAKGKKAKDLKNIGLSVDMMIKKYPTIFMPDEKDYYKNVSSDILFKELISFGEYLSMGDLEDVFKDMVGHFKQSSGSEYSNPSLTRAMKQHETTVKLSHKINWALVSRIKKFKGRLTEASLADFPNYLNKNNRPKFDTTVDMFTGLQITVNDTWAQDLELINYKFEGMHYELNYRLTIWDHFGLDPGDIKKWGRFKFLGSDVGWGFRNWFMLQHLKRHDFKPFITKGVCNYILKGKI